MTADATRLAPSAELRCAETPLDPLNPAAYPRLEAHNVRLLDGVRTGPGRWAALRFAVTQRVFGLGLGKEAAVRAWYRRYSWRLDRRELGRAGAALALLKTPPRVVRQAWRAAATHGPAVREAHGVPVRTQFLQLAWLGLRLGFDGDSYYRFWLFRRDRRRRAHRYIQMHEAAFLYRVLVVREAMDDFLITEDKRRFEPWCREHGLPTVPVLAEFADGCLVAPDPPRPLPARDLFSKPTDQYGGEGARRWRSVGGGRWADGAGGHYDHTALMAALAAQSRGGRVILQECLVNDPALAHLSSGALCTVRILTARPPGGAPEPVCALYRMSVGESSTDNFSVGGIAAPVDLATGRLGPGVRGDPRLLVAPVSRHPDTGAALDGSLLPYWEEAKALALRAHTRLRALACVGWDVALTPAGPVLIEGNFAPGARLAQAPSGVPLGETNYLRYLDAHLRRSFSR